MKFSAFILLKIYRLVSRKIPCFSRVTASYSMWYKMRFDNDLNEGEYAPDFDLLARFADEMLIEYKQQVLVNKLIRIQNDF